ncbi:MAG: RidA family protein [Termitinemataceae bacterium]
MKKKIDIALPGAAPLESPRSHATAYENLIFVSGQVARDLMTGENKLGTIEEETEYTLRNIEIVLKQAGSSLDCVLKTTVFLTNKEDFAGMNRTYRKFFPGDKPARSTIVCGLAGVHRVEIEAIAFKPPLKDQ